MKRISVLTIAAALAVLPLLAACDPKPAAKVPVPMEISDSSVSEFCDMQVFEHPGPKAQIFVAGRATPYWFASVRDAFVFTMLPEEPKDVVAIYVNDMGKVRNWDRPEPGTWIEAHKALFIVNSRQRGGMGVAEAVPFSDRAKAETFVRQYGGRIVGFDEVPDAYPLQESDVSDEADGHGVAKDPAAGHASPHGH